MELACQKIGTISLQDQLRTSANTGETTGAHGLKKGAEVEKESCLGFAASGSVQLYYNIILEATEYLALTGKTECGLGNPKSYYLCRVYVAELAFIRIESRG